MRKQVSLSLLYSLIVAVLISPAALARAANLDLAAQPLSEALRSLGTQAKINVLYQPEYVRGRDAPEIVGARDVDEALTRLLVGTGLTYRYINSNTVTLIRLSSGSASAGKGGTELSEQRMMVAETGAPSSTRRESRDEGASVGEGKREVGNSSGRRSEGSRSGSEGRNIEEVVVTGSHIRGGSTSLSPLTVFDRSQIARLGITSTGEMLNALPQNQGSVFSSPYSTLGASHFPNLRGLGEGTTLVLIDGQRPATSATSITPAAPAQFNLDVIPVTAIERIEILRDGASAVYGADAVGGVMNVILRKQFNGVEASAKRSLASDISENSFNALAGTQIEKLSFMIGGEYYDRGALLGSKRPYSRSLNKSEFGGTDGSFPGYAAPVPANISALPGNGNLPGLSSPIAAVPSGDTHSLQLSDFVPTQGQANPLVDYTAFSTLVQPQERSSAFAHIDFELNDDWRLNADMLYTAAKTPQEFNFPIVDAVFGAANPYNPFGVDTNVSFYLNDVPYSSDSIDTKEYGGSFGFAWKATDEWELRATARVSKSELDHVSVGYDYLKVTDALLSGSAETALNPLYGGSGSSRSLLDSLSSTSIVEHASTRDRGATLSASGVAFALPAGDVRVAAGAEARNEKLDRDYLAYFLGATSPDIIAGERDVEAAYSELSIPLYSKANSSNSNGAVDLSLAARYEHYSDFGSSTNPKIGISWRPSQALTLRSTWGTAFQAPSISQLDSPSSATPGILFQPVTDPLLNQTYNFSTFIQRGNMNLRPQKADTFSAGFTYDNEFGEQAFIASVDYYRVNFNDRIRAVLGAQEIVDLENIYPELVVRDPVTQRITDLIGAPVNLASVTVAGLDFSLGHKVSIAGGTVDTMFLGTLVDKYDLKASPLTPTVDRRSYIGFSNRFKSSLQILYSRTKWSLSSRIAFANRYRSDLEPGEISSQTTMDLQAAYFCCENAIGGIEDIKATLGVINVFNREPPFYNSTQGFDVGSGDPIQRRVYAQLAVTF